MTDNKLFDGRILLRQPVTGFRSGSDALLLAAACHPPAGGSVLELGTASGAALLALGARRPDVRLTGLEIDPGLANLCAFNLGRNGMRGEVVAADVLHPPLPKWSFDLVLANPPYFVEGRHRRSPDPERDRARAEGAARLADWIRAAVQLMTREGQAIFILRRERQAELIAAAKGLDVTVRPVIGAPDKPAKRVLVRLIRGAGLQEGPPLYLHYPGGAETALARHIFRHGAPIFWQQPVVSPRQADT